MKYNNYKIRDLLLIKHVNTGLQSIYEVENITGGGDINLKPFYHPSIVYYTPTTDEITVSNNPHSFYFNDPNQILGSFINLNDDFEKDPEKAREKLIDQIRITNNINESIINPVPTPLLPSTFTLSELEAALSHEVLISKMDLNYHEYIGNDIHHETLRSIKLKADDLIPVYEGSENMYFKLCGHASTNNVPFEITIFSKDNHLGLIHDYSRLVEQNISQASITGTLYSTIYYAYKNRNFELMQSLTEMLPHDYALELKDIHQNLSRIRNVSAEESKEDLNQLLDFIKSNQTYQTSPISHFSITYSYGPDITGKNLSAIEFQDRLKTLYSSRWKGTEYPTVYFDLNLENGSILSAKLQVGDLNGTLNPFKQSLLDYLYTHPGTLPFRINQTHKIIHATKENEKKKFMSRSILNTHSLSLSIKNTPVNASFLGDRNGSVLSSKNLNLFDLYDGTKKIATGSIDQIEWYLQDNKYKFDSLLNINTQLSRHSLVLSAVSDPYIFGERAAYKLYTHILDDSEKNNIYTFLIDSPLNEINLLLDHHKSHSVLAHQQYATVLNYDKPQVYERIIFQLLKEDSKNNKDALINIWENLSTKEQIRFINTNFGIEGNKKLERFLINNTRPIDQMTVKTFILKFGNTNNNLYDPHILSSIIKENYLEITGNKRIPTQIPDVPVLIELISYFKQDITAFKAAWENEHQDKLYHPLVNNFNKEEFESFFSHHTKQNPIITPKEELIHFLFCNYDIITGSPIHNAFNDQYFKEFAEHYQIGQEKMEQEWMRLESFLTPLENVDHGNTIDLFEMYHLLPQDVQDVIYKFPEDANYQICDQFIKDLNYLGYTCDYGLDASPFSLRKLNTHLFTDQEVDNFISQVKKTNTNRVPFDIKERQLSDNQLNTILKSDLSEKQKIKCLGLLNVSKPERFFTNKDRPNDRQNEIPF